MNKNTTAEETQEIWLWNFAQEAVNEKPSD